MTKQEMIDLLNGDLRNELKHMLFYLHHASAIVGLEREELSEMLQEEAQSEMQHVREFQDLIIGLGGLPTTKPNNFNLYLNAESIFTAASLMEDEVVANYAQRMDQAAQLGGADGKWIEVFLEDQILHSRKDADKMRRMITAASPGSYSKAEF